MDQELQNLLLATLGTIGTAIGAYVGYRGALKAATIQIEHANQTRFDEERVAAYKTFLLACSQLVELPGALEDPGGPHDKNYQRGEWSALMYAHKEASELRDRLEDSFLQIELIAPSHISEMAGSVRNSALLVAGGSPLPLHLTRENALESNWRVTQQLKELIRKEHGARRR